MRTSLIIIILLSFISVSNAQSISPVQIAEKYFTYDTIDFVQYLTGESLKNYTKEKEELSEEDKILRDSIRKEFEIVDFVNPAINAVLIEEKQESAVVSVNVSEGDLSEDVYLYFKYSDGWKLEAQRGLALSGFIYMAVKEWEKKTPEQLQEYISNGGNIDEMNDLINTSKLLLKDDEQVMQHFRNNRNEFNNFLEEAKLHVKKINFADKDEYKVHPTIDEYKKKLFISQVSKESVRWGNFPNVYFFSIGGMVDNTAGYLYAESKEDLPSIDKSSFIIIKEIGDGWYLYKTT